MGKTKDEMTEKSVLLNVVETGHNEDLKMLMNGKRNTIGQRYENCKVNGHYRDDNNTLRVGGE